MDRKSSSTRIRTVRRQETTTTSITSNESDSVDGSSSEEEIITRKRKKNCKGLVKKTRRMTTAKTLSEVTAAYERTYSPIRHLHPLEPIVKIVEVQSRRSVPLVYSDPESDQEAISQDMRNKFANKYSSGQVNTNNNEERLSKSRTGSTHDSRSGFSSRSRYSSRSISPTRPESPRPNFSSEHRFSPELIPSRFSLETRSPERSMSPSANRPFNAILDDEMDDVGVNVLLQGVPEGIIKDQLEHLLNKSQEKIDALRHEIGLQKNMQKRTRDISAEGAEERLSVFPDDPDRDDVLNDPVFLEELKRLGKESGENTVYIGLGKHYDKTLWEIMKTKKPSKFLRFIVDQHFFPAQLKNKCLERKKTYITFNQKEREEFTSEELRTIEERKKTYITFNQKEREEFTSEELRTIEVLLKDHCDNADRTGALATLWQIKYKTQVGYAIQDAGRHLKKQRKKREAANDDPDD